MSERRNKIAESVLSKLRAKLAEDTEELDEVSKSTLGSYIKKATNQVFSKGVAGGMGLASSNKEDEASGHRQVNKAAKRMLGVNKAASKLSGHGYTKVPANEEAEDLDELYKTTLKSYIKKAGRQAADADDSAEHLRGLGDKWKEKMPKNNAYAAADKHAAKSEKRLKGIRKAVGKLDRGEYEPGNHKVAEEVEELDELSKETLRDYAQKAKTQLSRSEYLAGAKMGQRMHGAKPDAQERKLNQRSNKRYAGLETAINKLAKEENECCATDTSLSDIKPSAKGEVYSKTKEKSTAATKPTGTATGVTAGKTGEAYNSTGLTKRIPAVESAVAEVMAKSLERRRIYNESANIAIISPEQRQDWMNVERGMMDVVSYFNKYRAGEE